MLFMYKLLVLGNLAHCPTLPHGPDCFIFVFMDIYIKITKAFGLPKPSLFCNVQRDIVSLPSYSKLNSKHNRWNSHMLPHLLLIGSC